MSTEKITAPFTVDQVHGLDEYQQCGHVHPFTCGTEDCGALLNPTVRGWECAFCDYKQDWAWAFMSNGAPKLPWENWEKS